jgi:hypothetical protein
VNNLLTARFIWWKQWRRVEEGHLRGQGFKVIHVEDTMSDELLDQVGDPDVHGVVVLAHGDLSNGQAALDLPRF